MKRLTAEPKIKAKSVTQRRITAPPAGRRGGHTPVFRWWVFTLFSFWKISAGIKLTNRDGGRVSLSLHCGPDRGGEKNRKVVSAKSKRRISPRLMREALFTSFLLFPFLLALSS